MDFLYGKRSDQSSQQNSNASNTQAQSPNVNSASNSGKPTNRNSPTNSVSSSQVSRMQTQHSSSSQNPTIAVGSPYSGGMNSKIGFQTSSSSSAKSRKDDPAQSSIFTLSQDSKYGQLGAGSATNSSKQSNNMQQNSAIAGAYSNILASIGLRNSSPKTTANVNDSVKKVTKQASDRLFSGTSSVTVDLTNPKTLSTNQILGSQGQSQITQQLNAQQNSTIGGTSGTVGVSPSMFYGSKQLNAQGSIYNNTGSGVISQPSRNQYGQATRSMPQQNQQINSQQILQLQQHIQQHQHYQQSQPSGKNKIEILQTGASKQKTQDIIEVNKFKKRSNSPQSNTSSLIDTTSFNDTPTTIQNIPASLNKVNVIQPPHSSRSPQTSSRRVVNINKDKNNEYEEMKVGGTIESSDEDDEEVYDNPFQLQQQDILLKANQINQLQQQLQSTKQKMQNQPQSSKQVTNSTNNINRKSLPQQQFTAQQQAQAMQQKAIGRLTQGGQPTQHASDMYKKKVNQYLIHAAETGNTDSVQDALNKSKYGQYTADINSHNKEDWTTLHFAVSEGHYNIAQMVLENNADVNALTAVNRTPLHIACIRGRPEYVKLLLMKGANQNIQDIEGNTPIHYASEQGHKDILVQLLAKGPDLRLKNNQGKSAFDVSSSNRIFALFEEYIKKNPQSLKEDQSQSNLQNINQAKNDPQDSQISTPQRNQLEETKTMDPTYTPQNFQFAKNAMHHQNRIVIHIQDGILGGQDQNGVRAGNQTSQNAISQYQNSNNSNINSNGVQVIDLNNLNMASVKKSEIQNMMQQSTTGAYYKSQINKQTDGTQNTGSSQTSGGDYYLDNESSGQELTPQEEKISTQSFFPIQLLGKGSFGEVYLVQKKSNNFNYAMKVLSKQKIMGQNLVRYAKTERNVLSYTQHPFIVNLNYAFQTSDKLFLILDYCPGGDLARVLQRDRKFSEERARIYIAEILLAIQYLHKRDIIFRDLKPDNVVLDADGHALLTDFGLSKEGVLDNISARSFCGSVAYLAPEMLKRSGHGKSVDWYLLGVLLYEMLVGQPPYFCNNKEQLFYNIQKGVLKLPASISHEAKSLLISLLNRNPNRRLGAGPTDADEIKKHPFFDVIDWERIITRGYDMPKPQVRQIIQQNINPSIFEDRPTDLGLDGSASGTNNIPGWSFVNPLEANGNSPGQQQMIEINMNDQVNQQEYHSVQVQNKNKNSN